MNWNFLKTAEPKAIEQSPEAGIKALSDDDFYAIQNTVGGPERYQRMTAWAHYGMLPAYVERYDRIMDGGDRQAIQIMVNDLRGHFNRACERAGGEDQLLSREYESESNTSALETNRGQEFCDNLYSLCGSREHFARVLSMGKQGYASPDELEDFEATVTDTSKSTYDAFQAWMNLKMKIVRRGDGIYDADESWHTANDSSLTGDDHVRSLNSLVCAIWKHTPFGRGGMNPPWIISEPWDESGACRVHWFHPEGNTQDQIRASCYYVIDNSGVAYVEEYFEALRANNFKQQIAMSLTIIRDIMGQYNEGESMRLFWDSLSARKSESAVRKRRAIRQAGSYLAVFGLTVLIGTGLKNLPGGKNATFLVSAGAVAAWLALLNHPKFERWYLADD